MSDGSIHRMLPPTTDRPTGLRNVYLRSWWTGWRTRHILDHIECYCMFAGYPRSGHTLIGALLNAHPEMVIAHELDALGYLHAGFGRRQLFALLLDRDKAHTDGGSRWEGYDYAVPGQCQGQYRTLRVIGDKKGGRSSFRLGAHPELLDRLRRVVGIPLRVIHEVRNPFDNIATLCLKGHSSTLEQCVDLYAGLLKTNQWLRGQLGEEMRTIRHEEFVRQPAEELQSLCGFLGVEADADYLQACAARVFDSPRKTRHQVPWPSQTRQQVESLIAEYDFLSGYAFDQP